MKHLLSLFVIIVMLPLVSRAGTITGQITTATNGPIANGTLTLALNQYAVVSGTAAIAPSAVNCYTDPFGNVVGLPNPLPAPVLSVNLGVGSLSAGTYYVVYAWSNSSSPGTTFYSPESSILLTGAGTLIVAVPASPPTGATNWKIFIGTSSLGETQQTNQAAPFGNYSQSTALVAGTALPSSNTTACSLRFNDELVPSFTKYNVSLKTQSGATVSGFPMFWQLFGGNAGTVNVSNGYLTGLFATGTNVTSFFDKIPVPGCSNVYFSPTLNRMIWQADALASGFYISPLRDPETIFGSTGFVQVSQNDGEKRMGWVDFKGVQIVLKERSGHEIDPSANNPANWTARRRWAGSGPCGIRAYDVGQRFIAYAHRSGLYIYEGDTPERISKEIPVTWSQVNWAFQHTIWVKIDEETLEVRVGVPLGQATVPSHIIKVNYEEADILAPPAHSSIYSRGKFISSASARKWSVDTIAANICIRAERTLLNPPADFDANTRQTQLLFASSNPDGAVDAVTPGIFNDNGNGLDSVYETVCPGELLKVTQLGGVQANVGGSGAIGVTVLALSTKATADGGTNTLQTEKQLSDCQAPNVGYKAQSSGQGERYRVRFSNKKAPNAWFDLRSCYIYARPVFLAKAK